MSLCIPNNAGNTAVKPLTACPRNFQHQLTTKFDDYLDDENHGSLYTTLMKLKKAIPAMSAVSTSSCTRNVEAPRLGKRRTATKNALATPTLTRSACVLDSPARMKRLSS